MLVGLVKGSPTYFTEINPLGNKEHDNVETALCKMSESAVSE